MKRWIAMAWARPDSSFRGQWLERSIGYQNWPRPEIYQSFYEIITELVTEEKPRRVLEYGCGGNGDLSKQVYSRNPKLYSHGCDYVGGTFEYLSKELPWLKLTMNDITNLAYVSDSFDVAFGGGVLMYIPPQRIEKAIQELARVAKKVIVAEYYPKYLPAEKAREYRNLIGVDRYEHDYTFIIEKLGYKIQEQFFPEMFHDPKINKEKVMGFYIIVYGHR